MSEKKLWGGRFDLPTNKLVEEYTASILVEPRMAPFDIRGSIVHATMLARQNIITKEDADKIITGLNQVEEEIHAGAFVFSTADEDIHMAVEKRMTQLVGDVGGKLHTARSRNDQTTLDSKMQMRSTIKDIQAILKDLQKEIIKKAEENITAIMPGYTHMHTGQPILLSHWVMA